MGWPALIAGLVLSAAGTASSMAANARSNRRMNDIANQTLADQERASRESFGVAQEGIAQTTRAGAEQEMGAEQARMTEMYNRAQATPLTVGSPPGSPGVTQFSMDRPTQMAIGQSNQAMAGLQAPNQYFLNQQIANIRRQQQIGVLQQNALGAARIMPIGMNWAQNSTSAARGAGSTLSGIGNLVGVAGAYGAPSNGSKTGGDKTDKEGKKSKSEVANLFLNSGGAYT